MHTPFSSNKCGGSFSFFVMVWVGSVRMHFHYQKGSPKSVRTTLGVPRLVVVAWVWSALEKVELNTVVS